MSLLDLGNPVIGGDTAECMWPGAGKEGFCKAVSLRSGRGYPVPDSAVPSGFRYPPAQGSAPQPCGCLRKNVFWRVRYCPAVRREGKKCEKQPCERQSESTWRAGGSLGQAEIPLQLPGGPKWRRYFPAAMGEV